MSSPHRRPPAECSLALRCPHCTEPFFVAPLHDLVSVAPCPHPQCRLVTFACQGAAMPHARAPAAITTQTLLGALDCPVESLRGVATVLGMLVPFVVVPASAWVMAWSGDYPAELERAVVLGCAPGLIASLVAVLGLLAAAMGDWRERARVRRARHGALEHARWIQTQRLPEYGEPDERLPPSSLSSPSIDSDAPRAATP